MAEYTVPVRIALDKEQEKDVIGRIESIQAKLKEAKSLADELASFLSELTFSVNVETD